MKIQFSHQILTIKIMLSVQEKNAIEINANQKQLVNGSENEDNKNESLQTYVDYLSTTLKTKILYINHPVYRKLKLLYEISQRDNVNQTPDMVFYSLASYAIQVYDYEFAWYLVNKHSRVLTIIKLLPQISPLFPPLLCAPTEKCNTYSTALMTIMLTINIKLDLFVKEHLLQTNPELLHLAKLIDTKLFTAVITFINPFQKTLHENLTLSLRLELAKYYLRSELGKYIYHLTDFQLERILLERVVHYVHLYYPHNLCSSLSVSLSINKLNPPPEWKIQTEKIILNQIKKNIWLFLVPEHRNRLIKQLTYFPTHLLTDIESLPSVINPVFNVWKKYAEIDAMSLDRFQHDTMIDYLLGYALQLHLDLLPILTSERIRNLTEDYSNLGKLITYLKSEDFIFKKYHSQFNLRIDWLLIKIFQSSKHIGSFFVEQLDALLKTTVITFTNFANLVLLAVNSREYELVKLLLNQCNLPINYLDEKMALLNFVKLFLADTQRRKIFFLLDHLSEFINKIPADQLSQILTTIKNPDHYLLGLIEQYKSIVGPFDFSPYLSIKLMENVKRRLRTLLGVKTSYLKLKKYELFTNSDSSSISFTKITTENYISLMKRGIETNEPPIATEEEFLCYKKLLSLPWKLGHRVENPLNLKKIIFDQEIRSPRYRATLGELMQVLRTPGELNLEGFIFLTLGPCKSPVPNILRNSVYFEFDVDKLIQKFPDFFAHSHLSYHWFAFLNNQEFPPVNYMGSIMHTVHDQDCDLQRNYYYDKNNQYNQVVGFMSHGLYNGKRILHILSLLFIKKLRSIGGDFYQYVLNHIDDTELLSNVFSQLMHPGYFEIRYPHAIPIDDSYCEIKTPAIKILNEKQLIEALDNIEFLKSCLLAGFDPEQQSAFYLKEGDKTNCCWGNFLARAIASNKTGAIDFLMEYGGTTYFKQSVTSITPLDAAMLTHNKPIAMRLLVKGIPLRGIPGSSYFPPLTAKPEIYLKQFTTEEIYSLAQQGNLILMNELLQNCIARLCKKTEDKTLLFVTIKLLLEKSADPNYKPPNLDNRQLPILIPIIEAIRSGANEIAQLFIEHDKYESRKVFSDCDQYCILEVPLLEKNQSLLKWIIEKNHPKNFKLLSKIHILMFYIAKEEELFQLAVTKVFQDIGKSLTNGEYIQQWLEFMLQKPQKNIEKILLFLKSHVISSMQTEHFNWVDRLSLNRTLQILATNQQFRNVQTLKSYRLWKLISEFFPFINTVQFVKDYLIENNIFYKKIFFYKYIRDLPADSNILDLFAYLKNQPEFFVLAFIHYSDHLNLDTSILERLLEIFVTHNFNSPLSQDLYDLLCNPKMITNIIQASAANKIPIKLFSLWLLKMVNADEEISSRLCMISELILFIWKNVQEIWAAIDQKVYSVYDVDRLMIFIHYIYPFKLKKTIGTNILYWGKRIGIGLQFIDQPNPQIIDSTLFNSMKLTLHSRIRSEVFATASIITCIIKDIPHLYLGKKLYYGQKLPYLLVPGGYCTPEQEPEITGAIREVFEETKFKISLSINYRVANTILFKGGDIAFESHENYPNQPAKISLLYQHSFINNFKPDELQRKRNVAFFWFDFKSDLSEKLTSGDDFADGIWVPIPEITWRSSGNYVYKNQPILLSNVMLLQLTQNKYVSPTDLDEALYKEAYQRHCWANFFSYAKSIPLKRELPESVENNTAKFQKIA